MNPVLSLTEAQEFAILRTVLTGILPAGTPVVKGQVNRVAQPQASNFCVYWPLRMPRLGTNVTEFYDNIFTGSIAGSTLTVSSIQRRESALFAGMGLTDGTAGLLAGSTTLGAQLTGSVGGTGTYVVTPAQVLGAETLYAGVRADLTPTEWVVQLDVHGPASADYTRVIEGLFRSEYGVDAFIAAGESQAPAVYFTVIPLYADEPRQLPFNNDQQQVEDRWSLDLHVQINPVVSTQQDFADQIEATAVPADIIYLP